MFFCQPFLYLFAALFSEKGLLYGPKLFGKVDVVALGASEGIGFYEAAASSEGCTHTPSVAYGASSLSEGALGNLNSGRCLQRVHVFSGGELYYYAVVFAARVLGRIKYH